LIRRLRWSGPRQGEDRLPERDQHHAGSLCLGTRTVPFHPPTAAAGTDAGRRPVRIVRGPGSQIRQLRGDAIPGTAPVRRTRLPLTGGTAARPRRCSTRHSPGIQTSRCTGTSRRMTTRQGGGSGRDHRITGAGVRRPAARGQHDRRGDESASSAGLAWTEVAPRRRAGQRTGEQSARSVARRSAWTRPGWPRTSSTTPRCPNVDVRATASTTRSVARIRYPIVVLP